MTNFVQFFLEHPVVNDMFVYYYRRRPRSKQFRPLIFSRAFFDRLLHCSYFYPINIKTTYAEVKGVGSWPEMKR